MKKLNTNHWILIITGISIFVYFSFIKEYLAFKDVVTENTIVKCKEYYIDYPQGRHLEDVNFIEVRLTDNINVVREFMSKYSKSKYYSEAQTVKNKLWQGQINNYEFNILRLSPELKKSNEKSISFFRELLKFMKHHDRSVVYVKLDGKQNLKELDEYNSRVVEKLKLYFSKESHPLEGNLLPLKSNFYEADLEDLNNIILTGVSNSFRSIFQQNYFDIEIVKDSQKLSSIDPVIDIKYLIENKEFESNGERYPDIWTYTENENFKSYILQIDVKFDFGFIIPSTQLAYNFQHTGLPGKEIRNIENIEQGYKIATKNTFNDFANIASLKFGLVVNDL
jgi:hypothetical protein